MNFPRNEIWFRKVYQKDVENKAITIIYRPDDRICDGSKKKCFELGEEVTLRVLEKPGDDKRKIKPEFAKGLIKKVKILNMKKSSVDELKTEDFIGSYPDIKNSEQLRYHLGKVYNNIPENFTTVTKITLEYLD